MKRAVGSQQDAQLHILEDELKNREHEIALLKETGDAVISELNLEKVFHLVAERACALIHAKALLIPILNEDCMHYTYRAGFGANIEGIVGETLPLEYGVCGWVWRHKRAWWRGALEDMDDNEKTKWEHEAGNLIVVPLIGKRHFLGGIAGINKIGGGDFTRRDLDLLTMFASQVSVAIENATLFEKSEDAKLKSDNYHTELEKLNQELAEANKQLGFMALHDPLTRLPNRTLVLERLQQAILACRRHKQSFAVLMMDLNRFKEINDTLGHNIGDELLKAVSARAKTALREIDTFGRLGGDEFVFIVPGTSAEGAVQVVHRLNATLETPIEVDGCQLYVEASFGIALCPTHGADASTLLKHADVAMYVAKRVHDTYFIYDPAQDINTPHRLTRNTELRQAVQENLLEMYYQPKINLSTGKVIGVEALSRWPHGGQYIPPTEFIAAMEQTGLIRPFARWALDTALRQHAMWKHEGQELSMAVNLSMYNLRDPNLPTLLNELMQKWEIDAGSLILELTESAFIQDPEHMLAITAQIESLGAELSIDDFGTGYSSLSYLKKLPVHEIKIDRSFVSDMTTDSDDATIVHSTIDLAHNLGLRVVAEGAESREILDHLLEQHCDIAQGYQIGRARPGGKWDDFISNRHN